MIFCDLINCFKTPRSLLKNTKFLEKKTTKKAKQFFLSLGQKRPKPSEGANRRSPA